MPPWDDGLSGVHRAIAEDNRTPIHVLAGPGTGKTFAMMRRVARLLEDGVRPERILAISFTRTAAQDLETQLEALEADKAKDVLACTLHSLCFRILAEEQVFQYTGRVARPILSHEVDQLIEDLAPHFGGKRAVGRLLKAFEASWARLQSEDPGAAVEEIDKRFHAALLDWLRYHRCMLVGELVPLTLDFVRNNPAIPVLPVLEHVLVDEYQDLNKADQALVKKLAVNGALAVIGDDNQSIYSFRHANPEGIRTFPGEAPNVICYQIDECKRCPPNIVALSNSLISHDASRSRDVPLVPDPGRRDAEMWVVQHSTLGEEASAIGDFVRTYLDRHPDVPPGKVLVLAPRRIFGNAIKQALIERRLNALSYFSEDPLDNTPSATGFCLLSLLVDPTDRPAVRAWLGLGATAGGHSLAYDKVRRHAEAAGADLRGVLDDLAGRTLKIPHTGRLVMRWRKLGEEIAKLEPLSGLDLVRKLWPPEDPEVNDIRLLAERIAVLNSDRGDLLQALREDITQPNLPPSDGDIIRVMSLHKSKGLTATLVVVAGCVAGAVPTIDQKLSAEAQAAQLQEQRRLLYVALTRATDTLVISAPASVPMALAYRANVAVRSHFGVNSERFARLAMTPFLPELGATAPSVLTSTQWRTAAGFLS